MIISALLFVPWLLWSFYLTSHSLGGIDWIKETWASTHPLLAIPKSLEVFTLGSQAGFPKVQSLRIVGSLLVPFVVLALFVPIGAKLLLYYSVPPRLFARATAIALQQLVHNGDVVVLSRTRAKTTICYLTRLGYQWEEGRCHNDSAGRSFSCWIYPPEIKQKTAVSLASRALKRSEAAREEAQQYIRALHPREGVL